MHNISILFFPVAMVIVIIMLDKSRQKQIDTIRNDFKTLLSVVDSLRFRVFDHERQLLDKEGVFVPEDTGIFAFKLMWSILDDNTKKEVEEEYKDVCPSHIPLWKYVIYSYKFSPNFERKIELRKIETIEDIINGNLKETSEAINELKLQMEQVKNLESGISSISSEINDMK